MKEFYQKHKQIIVFLLRALGIYLAWSLLYDGWLYEDKRVDALLVKHLISSSSALLQFTGYTVYTQVGLIGITEPSVLVVSPSCDGLSLFVLFAGFIIAYPGKWKQKFIFIPIGLLIIDALNVLRIAALVLIVYKKPQWLEFNHSYTFTLIMYLIIFGLWMWWIKRTNLVVRGKKMKVSEKAND